MQRLHSRKSLLAWFRKIATILAVMLALGWIIIPKASQKSRAFEPQTTTPIQHVIMIMMENHSFNNLFGRFPGARGQQVPLAPNPMPQDFDHSRPALMAAMDGGKMDEFPAYTATQYSQQDLPNYWSYAQQFGLGDNFFTTAASSSTPNHLSEFSAGQSPIDTSTVDSGCGSAQYDLEYARKTSGYQYFAYPCYNITNIPTELAQHSITWRNYVQGTQSIWDPTLIIKNLYHSPNDVYNPNQIISDVKHQKLAAVSWVSGPGGANDHPPLALQPGENFITNVANTIMNPKNIDPLNGKPYWQDTALFVTWDDWGSFYDPIVPPQIDGLGDGPRTALLVISAYAKKGYISHNLGDFSSFDKFIEKNWSIPSLGYRDSNPSISDLTDYFNFSQKQAPFILPPVLFPDAIKIPTKGIFKGQQFVGGALTPLMGGENRSYTYRVIYNINNKPKVHNVNIDGKAIPMKDVGHIARQGELYQYVTKLGAGTHTFTFTFSNVAPGSTMTLPYNTPFIGPMVYAFTVGVQISNNFALINKPVTYTVSYASLQNKKPTHAELDVDGVSVPLQQHGTSYKTGVTYTYTTSALAAGEHYFRVRFNDGSGMATFEGNESPTVIPFTLGNSSVQPPNGSPSTPFVFQTTYNNVDKYGPTSAQVYVDGTAYAMTLYSGTPTDGVYRSNPITLQAGNHKYAFLFSDPDTSWQDPKYNSSYAGPYVNVNGSAPPAGTMPTGTIIEPSHDQNPDFEFNYSDVSSDDS